MNVFKPGIVPTKRLHLTSQVSGAIRKEKVVIGIFEGIYEEKAKSDY